jgi:quercetin dioxygenase-like cupin family protein
MKYKYPHTIENCIGEKIIFQAVDSSTGGDKVIVESFCKSGSGPAMHTHLQQEEELTVVSGLMGYQILGQEPKFAKAGETVLFKRGMPHKFWAEGSGNLHCTGWIQPANSIVFFFRLYMLLKINQERASRKPLMRHIYLQNMPVNMICPKYQAL